GVPAERRTSGARRRGRHRLRRSGGASGRPGAARRRARSAARCDQGSVAAGGRRSLPRGVARVTAVLRRLTSAPTRVALGAYVPARTASWPEASRLFVVGDDRGWSIDDDRARLTATALRLGCTVAPSSWARFSRRQAVFHHDHFGALQPPWLESSHRLGLSYFHGRPDTPGYPEFDRAYETLRRNAGRI